MADRILVFYGSYRFDRMGIRLAHYVVSELSGRGADVDEELVYLEEMNRVRAPGPVNVIGVSNIAPAIMHFGTAEQKKRFLTPMLRGDEI